jgi:hypothetical protein
MPRTPASAIRLISVFTLMFSRSAMTGSGERSFPGILTPRGGTKMPKRK